MVQQATIQRIRPRYNSTMRYAIPKSWCCLLREYGPTETTTTLLQTAQKGKQMNTLENYYIQSLQHNTIITYLLTY
jgi:hypothetical protein